MIRASPLNFTVSIYFLISEHLARYKGRVNHWFQRKHVHSWKGLHAWAQVFKNPSHFFKSFYLNLLYLRDLSSGRTMSSTPSVLEEFKKLVREQGMSDDSIIIKKDKGETHTHKVNFTHHATCSFRSYCPTRGSSFRNIKYEILNPNKETHDADKNVHF